MSIDTDTARRVAHLARIAVTEDHLEPLAAELSAILGFMEQLREVDVAMATREQGEQPAPLTAPRLGVERHPTLVSTDRISITYAGSTASSSTSVSRSGTSIR